MIKTITYNKKFPTGPFLNETIGFEMGIDLMVEVGPQIEKDNEQYVLCAIENLRCLAEKSHKEKYPHLYTESGIPVTIEQVESPVIPKTNEEKKKQQIDNFVEAISTCTSLKALEMFRKLVERENIPSLTERFNNKEKNLKGEHN